MLFGFSLSYATRLFPLFLLTPPLPSGPSSRNTAVPNLPFSYSVTSFFSSPPMCRKNLSPQDFSSFFFPDPLLSPPSVSLDRVTGCIFFLRLPGRRQAAPTSDPNFVCAYARVRTPFDLVWAKTYFFLIFVSFLWPSFLQGD